MVIHSLNHGTRTFFAALILMVALLFTLPFAAQAQQEKPQTVPEKSTQQRTVSPEQVEKHIARLHDQLQVTAPQDAAWKDFAQVMRDNSKQMNALIDKWAQGEGKRTAVENMKAQKEMADEYAQSLSRLIPVLETLYASMSPEQKKGADMVFEHKKVRGPHKGKNS